MLVTIDNSRPVIDNIPHACNRCGETIHAGQRYEHAWKQSPFRRQRYNYRLCYACVQASNQLVKEVAAHG